MTNRALKKAVEKDLDELTASAFWLITRRVQSVCDRNHWNFSTADIFSVWKRSGARPAVHERCEVENAATRSLFDLVAWYEDKFGTFPQVMYDQGKWYPEHFDCVGPEDLELMTSIPVRFSPSQRTAIDKAADQLGLDMSSMLRRLVTDHIAAYLPKGDSGGDVFFDLVLEVGDRKRGD